ncbi:hypothetical protein ACWNX6_00025 [Candidatus Vidania fulgoroideorum]
MNKEYNDIFFKKKLGKLSFFIIRYKLLKCNIVQKFRLICEDLDCKILFTKNSLLNLFLKSNKIIYKIKKSNFIFIVKDFFDFNKVFSSKNNYIEARFFFYNGSFIKKKAVSSLISKKNSNFSYLSFFLIFKRKLTIFFFFISKLINEKSGRHI